MKHTLGPFGSRLERIYSNHTFLPSLQAFGPITKVYVTGGEPCCAECVTPVFNEAWSSRASLKPRFSKLSHCSEEREGEEEGAEKGEESIVPAIQGVCSVSKVFE